MPILEAVLRAGDPLKDRQKEVVMAMPPHLASVNT
jgi:hypothetical protein